MSYQNNTQNNKPSFINRFEYKVIFKKYLEEVWNGKTNNFIIVETIDEIVSTPQVFKIFVPNNVFERLIQFKNNDEEMIVVFALNCKHGLSKKVNENDPDTYYSITGFRLISFDHLKTTNHLIKNSLPEYEDVFSDYSLDKIHSLTMEYFNKVDKFIKQNNTPITEKLAIKDLIGNLYKTNFDNILGSPDEQDDLPF